MLRKLSTWALILGICASAAACAGGGDVACRLGADCASGVCRSDGTCVPSGTGAGGSGGGTDSSSSAASGPSSSSASTGGATGSGGGACSPNQDGMITREEVPLAPGLHATFEVAEDAPVTSAGVSQPDGSRLWDLAGMLPGDHGELVETKDLAGAWFAADFPTATYTARLSDSADLLGVFAIDATSLTLQGVVSPTGGPTQTKLSYSPPITILRFPIHDGATWSTSSTVTGMANGVPGIYSESYDSKVDAHGTVKAPFGDFAVQRVRTDLVRTTGAIVTTFRTYAFVTECFGTIAKMVSEADELQMEFTKASEVTRLSP